MAWLFHCAWLLRFGSTQTTLVFTCNQILFYSSQIRRLGALDSAWVTSTTNGLQGHAHPAWLHLYLSTCKLLHLALCLPATRLPQFQMYRWAFVGDSNTFADGDIGGSSSKIQQQVTPNFIPYLTRIYRLLHSKVSLKCFDWNVMIIIHQMDLKFAGKCIEIVSTSQRQFGRSGHAFCVFYQKSDGPSSLFPRRRATRSKTKTERRDDHFVDGDSFGTWLPWTYSCLKLVCDEFYL